MLKSFVRNMGLWIGGPGCCSSACFLFPWTRGQCALLGQSSSTVMSHISHPLATAECFSSKHLISLVDLNQQASWESQVMCFFSSSEWAPSLVLFHCRLRKAILKTEKQKLKQDRPARQWNCKSAKGRHSEGELQEIWCHVPISSPVFSHLAVTEKNTWSPGSLVYEQCMEIHIDCHLLLQIRTPWNEPVNKSRLTPSAPLFWWNPHLYLRT